MKKTLPYHNASPKYLADQPKELNDQHSRLEAAKHRMIRKQLIAAKKKNIQRFMENESDAAVNAIRYLLGK